MTYWVLKSPYFAQFCPPTHSLGNWPKITNIQPILTIPSTPTPLLLPLIYLCKLIMNISQEKGRCSIMTKIRALLKFKKCFVAHLLYFSILLPDCETNSSLVWLTTFSKAQIVKIFAYVITPKCFRPWIDIEIGYIAMYSECLHRLLNRCTLSPRPSKF